MAGIPKVKISFDADYSELQKGVKGAQQEVQSFGDKVGEFGKKAAAAFAVAAVAAGAMAVKIGKEAITAASDLAETVSKVGVLFGDSAKEVEAFAESAAMSLGQSKQQALNAAATFATFGKAAGLAGSDLANFSTDFVTLASDLASFNNTSPEQAINAIGAALRGESEPLRAYGVLLDDASLRQAALELGIVSTTKNALTPQQKVLAAQKLIYEQTGAAQGDFARTSDGLANSQRILTARIENVKTVLGEALLPIALKVSEFVSTTLLPIIESLASSFDSGTGEGLLGKISSVANYLEEFFKPIWEAVVAAFGRVKTAIVDNKDRFNEIFTTLKELGKWVLENIIPIFKTQLVAAITAASSAITLAIKVIVPVVEGVTKIVKGLINAVIDGINLLIKAYNAIAGLVGGKSISLIPKIGQTTSTGSNTVPSSSLPSGFGSTSGASTATSTIATAVSTATNAAATAAASSAAKTAAETAAKVVGGSFNAGSFRAAEALSMSDFTGGSFNVGSFRAAESRSMAAPVNITIQGAIDPISTARQINEILKNESTLSGNFVGGIGISKFSPTVA